ncbi:Cas9 inhibitor AcrIIA9 family protein [Flavobacterium sp. 102]|uniref:PcfK-like family protein n=1 Tax=Flavobacterium sp. 102 TaxID=2135623 RepID=UPI000EB17343|nr:Cas9 inhibitor AcrIIA9 family protein [Flavobacterium sp. 102]RKS03420.1 PcfK-like protein [Flavobacterium sp. 102]
MEETTDPFKEAIVNHLQELANNDALFAITFSKPYKNIDDCATYILNEVKKSQRQGFDDDEIFNMAIHYYDEETVEIGKPIKAKVVVNRSIAAARTNDFPKSTTKNGDANQTSLFKL